MGRSQDRTRARRAPRGARLRATGGPARRAGRQNSLGTKPLPLLQAVWEQVAGEVLSAPPVLGLAPAPAGDQAAQGRMLDGTTMAEDSLDAAGVDLWGPVAVAVLGDARDTARQLRVIGERIGCVGAIVLDLRGIGRGGPEWACALLAAWTGYRGLGRECLIAAGNQADRVRSLPGMAGGLVFGTVEEAVWSALQIAGD